MFEKIFKKIKKELCRNKIKFTNSSSYWEDRYKYGANSGAGSYGRLAVFKAEVLNDFVKQNQIKSVLELGSGDGNQLKLAEYPSYVGVDVSKTVIEECKKIFANDNSKKFLCVDEYNGERAELTLSLDVVYHLVEDEVFNDYMSKLFDSAEKYVVVYASDKEDDSPAEHVRHRKFSDWVAKNRSNFKQISYIPNKYPFDKADCKNTSFSDFYIYQKNG